MTPVSEFRVPLRLMLGDNDPEGLFAYSDAILDSAVQTSFRLGRSPAGYTLTEDKTQIDTTIPDGSAFARIACETALMLVAGEETVSYTTRAISVRRKGDRIANLITELRMRLSEGDAFASSASFLVWLEEWDLCHPPEPRVWP